MTPFPFDVETAVALLGHKEVLKIEAEACAAAEHGLPLPQYKASDGLTYWSRVLRAMRHVVYCNAHDRHSMKIKKATG
jgi:hypothetical protein